MSSHPFLFTSILTALFTLANCDDSVMLTGSWVPADTHQIDYKKLPKIQSQHTFISDVRASKGVNQHNYLAFHGDQYFAMWSDGPGIEDQVGQRVKFATSPDAVSWSEPSFLTPEPPNSGPNSPYYGKRSNKGMRWIARGFWQRGDELLALCSLDEAAGFFGPSLELRAFRFTDDQLWEDIGIVAANAINNFPPQTISSGDWMMSRRKFDYKESGVEFLVGGVKSIDDWKTFPVLGTNEELSAEEPLWWSLQDNRLAAIFRDNSRSKFLYRAFSSDQGRTWTTPVRTNFPDATSKLFGLRLSNGHYVLISNSNPRARNPLTIAIGNDGVEFTELAWLVGGRQVDYPHAIEHDGHLLVAFASGKRTVEVLKIKLSELDKIVMPESVANDTPAPPIADPRAKSTGENEKLETDIAVYGATPGGIAAAIAAARLGSEVVLVEPNLHVGGMSTSGLGKSDIENRAMIGGIFNEFVRAQLAHYEERYSSDEENIALCRDGYYAEPSVSEAVFEAMLAKQKDRITVLKGWRLNEVFKKNEKVESIELLRKKDGAKRELSSSVFIDATYEGDLYAGAGAEYRLGRESRDEFDEPHAGVVYFDYQEKEFLPGTTGDASEDIPAFTYRLCLTKNPENSHRLSAPPPGYDRTAYTGYFDDLEAGRLAGPKNFKPGRGYNPAHFDTLVRALSVTDIPNEKTDVNINPRPLGFPFPEENRGYIEGNEETRDRIRARIRNLTLGLIWFLQNDPEVPEAHRKIANELQFPKDEFTDNDHFPWQLYVREGRRLKGLYTLTEHDITGKGQAPIRHDDSIAVGEFPIDSFPCRKRRANDTIVLEGYLGMLDHITRPYEIPYRIMIPEKVDGIIVPVAASTTHVAFSSIRMEPTWMALGQAAGTAAHLASKNNIQPRNISVESLRKILSENGQVLSHSNHP